MGTVTDVAPMLRVLYSRIAGPTREGRARTPSTCPAFPAGARSRTKRAKFSGINAAYQGLIPKLTASLLGKEKEGLQKHVREFVDRAVTEVACPDCGGTRLAPHAPEPKIGGKNIAELCVMEVAQLAEWFSGVQDASAVPLVAHGSPRTLVRECAEDLLGHWALPRRGGQVSRVTWRFVV